MVNTWSVQKPFIDDLSEAVFFIGPLPGRPGKKKSLRRSKLAFFFFFFEPMRRASGKDFEEGLMR